MSPPSTATLPTARRLGDCLLGCRAEIEEAILGRAYSISDPALVGDPEYVAGLRAAVSAGIDHAFSALEEKAEPDLPPPVLIAQARQAARYEISLDTVLRRYFAGYTMLSEFAAREARALGGEGAEEAQQFLGALITLFDRLVVSVAEEHRDETERRRRCVERTKAQRVKRLLAGELVEEVDLGYPLGGWHLGALVTGPGAMGAMRELAGKLDRRFLAVCPGEGAVWGWLGSRNELSAEVLAEAAEALPEGTMLSIGEPARGSEGWRLTHRQALAALPVVRRRAGRIVCYRDVALLACALSDDVLRDSLRELYLTPLGGGADDGAVLRQTLRAYFAAGQNASSAAAGLGVSRTTFASRLCTAEKRIGRPLERCAAGLQTALELQEILACGVR